MSRFASRSAEIEALTGKVRDLEVRVAELEALASERKVLSAAPVAVPMPNGRKAGGAART